MTPGNTLTFDSFVDYMSEGLEVDREALVPKARLIDDLGLDSFDLVELSTLVEELGVRFPDDVAVSLETVEDVYNEYTDRAQRRQALS